MSIFSEWKINLNLRNEIKKYQERISELEGILSVIKRNSKEELINLSLAKEILAKEKEIAMLKKKFDELKAWTNKIIEQSKKDSSEFASIKFKYFKLLKENQITEMNLTGANKGYELAVSIYKQVNEENIQLKKKLEHYERQNRIIEKP